MHDAFFGPAKKATYLFEPKLDLLRSEMILISRSKNMIFPEKAIYIVFLPPSHTKKATYMAFLIQNSIFCMQYPKLFWFVTEKIGFLSEKAT